VGALAAIVSFPAYRRSAAGRPAVAEIAQVSPVAEPEPEATAVRI
jgi:hypothetical protein